jgi:hypothetical protein
MPASRSVASVLLRELAAIVVRAAGISEAPTGRPQTSRLPLARQRRGLTLTVGLVGAGVVEAGARS